MFMESRHGALYVMQEQQAPAEITARLREIDDRLFLEQQITYSGEAVWCVVCDVGMGHPPITILEWRDWRTDEPISELTSGLVERVQAMERDGSRLSAKVVKANRDLIESHRQRAHDAWREIALDMTPRIEGKTSSVLHRSQALRMSRDKRRAAGEKV
jgi:hypothetical protein